MTYAHAGGCLAFFWVFVGALRAGLEAAGLGLWDKQSTAEAWLYVILNCPFAILRVAD